MLAKINPWTALVIVASIGAGTALTITGHALPAWIISALSTIVAGALKQLIAAEES